MHATNSLVELPLRRSLFSIPVKMMKLYGAGSSRWIRPYWTLNEVGASFEPVTVSLRKGEARTPEHLARQPFGKVPVLVDGDLTLFESAAICTYVGEKYPESGFVPAAGTRERAYYDQWVCFVISDFEQPLWRMARHTFVYPEGKRSTADIELAREDFGHYARPLEARITEYLVGNRFTVADILMAYTLKWASMYHLLNDFPKLVSYQERHTSREAFPRQFYT